MIGSTWLAIGQLLLMVTLAVEVVVSTRSETLKSNSSVENSSAFAAIVELSLESLNTPTTLSQRTCTVSSIVSSAKSVTSIGSKSLSTLALVKGSSSASPDSNDLQWNVAFG